MSSSASPVPLLKGYLPVRLILPPIWCTQYEDTSFFYVREHQGGKGSGKDAETASKSKSTLFVANAPVVPGISTTVLLRSLLGRFADIARVTVVNNPRGGDGEDLAKSSLKWTDKFEDPSFLSVAHSEGKFAHVVFESSKGMKKALRALQDVMNPKKAKGDKLPGLFLERIEIQTLSDETSRIHRKERKRQLSTNDDDDDSDVDESAAGDQLTGVHAVVARYRQGMAELNSPAFIEECNAVMEAYEEKEEQKMREQEAARSQPDEDGFVTVSYSNAVGSQIELEATKHATGDSQTRRKGNMRSRKKREAVGAKEQSDFYRFQRRDNKKRTLEDLRAQFEEDLQRVKRLKEERHYRPF